MCTLAHVFEAAGLSTVVLASIRVVAEKMHPPRALYCEFPLGRPLGRPLDPDYQHRVLQAAFELLQRPSGPVLQDFPDRIASEGAEPLACAIPPRFDESVPAAVDEARALRPAYDRALRASGRTSVGRVMDADGVPEAVAALVQIAEGADWKAAGLPGDPIQVAHDLRSYYEELAVELADGPPAPWAAERWFYDETETGRTLLAARRAMRAAEVPFPIWFYMAPGAEQ
ncbi:MAG: hypothetical protein ACE5IL_00370 [Myxococcota bacterium]